MVDHGLHEYDDLAQELIQNADGNLLNADHGPLDLLLDAIAGPVDELHSATSVGLDAAAGAQYVVEEGDERMEDAVAGESQHRLHERTVSQTKEDSGGLNMDVDTVGKSLGASDGPDGPGVQVQLMESTIQSDDVSHDFMSNSRVKGDDQAPIDPDLAMEQASESSSIDQSPTETLPEDQQTPLDLQHDLPTVPPLPIDPSDDMIQPGLTLEAFEGLFGGEGNEDELTPVASPSGTREALPTAEKEDVEMGQAVEVEAEAAAGPCKPKRKVRVKQEGGARPSPGFRPKRKSIVVRDLPGGEDAPAEKKNAKAAGNGTGRKRKRAERSNSPGGEDGQAVAGPGPSTARRRKTKPSTTIPTVPKSPSPIADVPTDPDPRTGILGGHDPKIARMFAATRGPNGSRIPEQSMSFSSITLLHGNVAQKTYGKEKRFLNPPPVVRMAGSVSDTVESISVQIINKEHREAGEGIPMVSNNQGVEFTVPGKELEARQYLREGLYFPGLFAASTGTAKTFHLKLNVYQPGGTDARAEEDSGETSEPLLEEPTEGLLTHESRADSIDLHPSDSLAARPTVAPRQSEEPDPATLATLAAQTMASSIEGIQQLQRSVDAIEEEDPLQIGPEVRNAVEGQQMEGILPESAAQAEPVSAGSNANSTFNLSANEMDAETLIEDSLLINLDEADELGQDGAEGDKNIPIGGNVMIKDILPEAMNQTRPWAEFESEPVGIISKPSKKTAKTKHVEGGLSVETPLAFWSRINQQAVRTKYMYVEGGKLQGRPCDWSAFAVDVIRRGVPSTDSGETSHLPTTVLTYGSTIILRDIHSGFRTEPLLLCKVSQGRLEIDDWGPVIDMQQCALAKVIRGQGRWYLRAPGYDRPVKNVETGKPTTRARRKPLIKETTNAAVIKKDAPEFDTRVLQQEGQHVVYAAPKVHLEMVNGVLQETEFIDDFICWTVASISEHNYTFFEGRHEVGDFTTVFRTALTPIPASIDSPIYRSGHNTLTMTVTNFLYDDDNHAFRNKPLLIYLGAIGPLAYRSYRSTAQRVPPPTSTKGKMADPDNYSCQYPRYPTIPIDGGEEYPPEDRPYSAIPHDVPHVILVIHLPAPEDIWDATRIERERAEAAEQVRKTKEAEDAEAGHPAIDDMDDDYTKYEEPHIPFGGWSRSTAHSSTFRGLVEDQANQAIKVQPEQALLEGDLDMNGSPAPADQIRLPPSAESSEPVIPMEPGLPEGTLSLTDGAVVGSDSALQHGTYVNHEEDYDHVDAASLDPTTGLRVDQAAPDSGGAGGDSDYDPDMLQTFEGDVPPHVQAMFTVAALERAANNADMLDTANILNPSSSDHQRDFGMRLPHEDAGDRLCQPSLTDVELDLVTEGQYIQYGDHNDVIESFDRDATQPKRPHSNRPRAKRDRKRKGPGEKVPKPPKMPKPPKERGIPRPRPPVIKPTLGPSALGDLAPPMLKLSRKPFTGPVERKNTHRDNNPMNLENLGGNSSLPLLFVRASDGTGYHTGKNVVIERTYLDGEWTIRVPE